MDPLVHHLLQKLAFLVRNQELREKIRGIRLTGLLRNTNGVSSNTGTDLVVVHRIVLLLECRRRQSGIQHDALVVTEGIRRTVQRNVEHAKLVA
jgi:hypothetical protein